MYTAVVGSDYCEFAVDVQARTAHANWFETKEADNAARISALSRPRSSGGDRVGLEPLPSSLAFHLHPLIVVVDDEPVIAVTLSEILIRRKFNAVWFTVSTEALEFIQEQEFHLLLSDIDMPTMDGISLADEVHRLHPHRPVFLFSGQIDNSSVRQRIGDLRLPVHLEAKPLRVDSLVSVVHDLLAMGDARRAVVEAAPWEMIHPKCD